MKIVRALACAMAIGLIVSLAACTTAPAMTTLDAAESQVPASPGATAPGATPSASASPTPTDSDAPIAKVTRPGSSGAAAETAEPATTTAPVAYGDGVSLAIVGVAFGSETANGPGSFAGREFARTTIELTNGSDAPIDLNTSVLTMLDAGGAALTRVYAAEAGVTDFAGTVAPGDTVTAVYAFAVPADARSNITLVVDFDAQHSSAVFRGGLV